MGRVCGKIIGRVLYNYFEGKCCVPGNLAYDKSKKGDVDGKSGKGDTDSRVNYGG